jgi:hypothetical protein
MSGLRCVQNGGLQFGIADNPFSPGFVGEHLLMYMPHLMETSPDADDRSS